MPQEELAAACDGTAVPWAAPYAGTVHPLVVIDPDWLWTYAKFIDDPIPADKFIMDFYAINKRWISGEWTSPMIQLVVCTGNDDSAVFDSCGIYTRESDGVTGKLVRREYTREVRVVVAKTGKTLQTKAIAGAVDECPGTYSSAYGDLSGDPPWELQAHEVTEAQVNKYATTVSKQLVR